MPLCCVRGPVSALVPVLTGPAHGREGAEMLLGAGKGLCGGGTMRQAQGSAVP